MNKPYKQTIPLLKKYRNDINKLLDCVQKVKESAEITAEIVIFVAFHCLLLL